MFLYRNRNMPLDKALFPRKEDSTTQHPGRFLKALSVLLVVAMLGGVVTPSVAVQLQRPPEPDHPVVGGASSADELWSVGPISAARDATRITHPETKTNDAMCRQSTAGVGLGLGSRRKDLVSATSSVCAWARHATKRTR